LDIVSLLVSFGLLMIAITVHEFAHALVAYKLGDNTAKNAGRVTLNPLAHIDIFWTLLLPIILFITIGFAIGSAKPVPINYWALKNPKRDTILIGASGPMANLILAFILSIIWRLIPHSFIIDLICENLIYINILLAVFNLLPIPPLDGSRILMGLLPRELAYRYSMIGPFGTIIIVLLLATIFKSVILPVTRIIFSLFTGHL
jgi:Zn-dependent protease